MADPVTLRDVAEVAGVSAKTVSRVVNGDRHVGGETRERVDSAIAKLGYRPNLAARSLVTARSYIVGVVSSYLRGFYYSELHAAAQKACRARGYHLLVEEYAREGRSSLTRLEESFRHMRLDGVMLTSTVADDEQVLALVERLGLRCVRVAPGGDYNRTDAVSANQQQGMTELAEHLLDLGHRQFGIVASPEALRSEQRHEMLTTALIARGVEPACIIVEQFDWDAPVTAGARAVAARFLAATPRPTAIFAATDSVAMPIIQFAFEHGLRVPQDLSVAGCDDSDIAEIAWPPLTTIHQPIQQMATEAISLLLAPRSDMTRHLMLAMRLVTRGSTAAWSESASQRPCQNADVTVDDRVPM